jgi:hypothetical protein
MPRPRNFAAFLFVGFCSWRVVACSPSKVNDGAPSGVGGLYVGQTTGGGGAGAQTGSGAGFGTAASGNGMGGAFLNINQAGNAGSSRDRDSACHPLSETPEKVTVTDSAVVTDTITTLTPVAIFIMQDRSSSTVTGNPAPASPESWKNSTDAVTAFVKDPLSAGLDIGLGVFPPMSNGIGDCSAGSDCGTPLVPIASLPNNAQNVINAYQTATPPQGFGAPLLFTPTECALRGMINTCLQYMAASPSGEKCVAVLVTDGTPTTCDTNEQDLTAIIADGKSKGVETYTLGLPGSDKAVLDGYAMAGGTGQSINVMGGAQAFVQALNGIRGKVSHQTAHTVQTTKVVQTPLKCQWKIPAPMPNDPPLDPMRVNVQFSAPNQPGQLFGHVKCDSHCSAMAPPPACPPSGQAWYYDDEKTPTQIFLCPSTCNAIKNVIDARVDLQFHCPQKPYVVQ